MKRVSKAHKTQKTSKKEVQRRSKQSTKLIAVGAVALLLAVFAIAICANQEAPITDDFFVSDDTKVVMSMDKTIASLENSEYESNITHMVYFIDGDKISNVKIYYEYESEAQAAEAIQHITLGDFAISKKLSGKYIILQAQKDKYEGLETARIQRQAASMKAAGALVDRSTVKESETEDTESAEELTEISE